MAINAKKIFGIVTTVALLGGTIYVIKKYYDSKRQDEKGIGLEEAKRIIEEGKPTLGEDGMENTALGSSGQVHYDPSLTRHTDNIKYVLNDDETQRMVEHHEDDKDYVDAHTHHQVKSMLNKNNGNNGPIGTLIPSLQRRTADKHTLNEDDMEDVKFVARDQAHYDPDFKRRTLSNDQMEELVDDARDQASYDSSFMDPNDKNPVRRPIAIRAGDVNNNPILEDEEEEEAFYERPDPEEVQDAKGYFEDKDVTDDLRYEPNSIEAREQFINMELANLGRDNDTRDVVAMLYDHPFVPTCDEDQNLKTRLIDNRIKFFGLVSRWTKEVTYGDVVMYYGKAAEFNCGEHVRHWVDYFLTCADINNITLTSDEIDERIDLLNKHSFFNEELQSHGLFGLNADQITEAITIARNRIDEKVTYDIEFHQFIQGVI